MPLDVLYEDAQLLAVAKPCGTVVVPARGPVPGDPLVKRVGDHVGGKVFPVHRLDRESSGVVLFAKDADTHRALCELFGARKVRKLYLAAVADPVEKDGVVRKPIREYGSGRMGVARNGKPSSTRYRVREPLKGATLLEVEPETGRRHQIRVHLYSIGHAILGDTLYGNPRPVGGAPRLMLHALSVSFELPGRPPLTVECPPPNDFAAIVAALRP
jgi:RluA family pseudouridine synthase